MSVSLPELSTVAQVHDALKNHARSAVEAVGLWGSAKVLFAYQVAERLQAPLLFVTAGRAESEYAHDDLITFAGEDNVYLMPAWEVLPTDRMAPADDIVAERMNTLQRLSTAVDCGCLIHGVVPLHALLQRVVSREEIQRRTLHLRVGQEWDLGDLLQKLVKMGYAREVMVEDRGEVSHRGGGLLDIFPISSELPCRIEFFGDEIESIRRFEPETQRSIDQEDDLLILPRSEKELVAGEQKSTLSSILDYLPKNALVVLDEFPAIEEEGIRFSGEVGENRYYTDWDHTAQQIDRFRRLSVAQVGVRASKDVPRLRIPTRAITNFGGQIDGFWEQLEQWDLDGFAVKLLCVNAGERRRLFELLEERGYTPGRGPFDLRVELGRLHAGFAIEADRLAVLSEHEMFGRHYVRRKRRRFEAGITITQFSDLKTGDYVVHALHGIGRYLGLRRFQGKVGDFMSIQYVGGDTIYVPVTHIDQVQKYVGGDGAMPKMDRIGGATWARKKRKVKKAVRDMAEDLIKLYAARENAPGHVFSPDTPWQVEFEDAFEYDETPDQARAIAEVKSDMESARPMDRLLCGDVGFGKTEVAIRAAFKAVMDGKQVAILAPTTVLTQQHYNTFRERLADYPVRVEVLNRFRSAREQKETIDRLKSGETEVVVGTHRLLSKDVAFKDLGLVVIDEEQRFGVAQKEKLKQLRVHVDVLTMSATPIPRTLHFSLIGVRDMSVINTAPNDRLPIHTCVEAWDEDLIKEAVEREMNREGQVFVLHNRVQTIEDVAMMVQKLVPRARIGIGHGQMARHDLEDVMAAFINRALDVLVCTTIIGSGIDIPNANTIVIDRADHYGLSQLYQIRGRVGRYKHRAFAYLLVPGDRALSEDAQQRLKALEDFSALGSGFRVAMRDLEIRGAGDLLGADQTGHISTVGYEAYKDIIAETVAEVRGEVPRRRELPPYEVAVDAYIPEEYVPTAQQKMTLYRRIANVASVEDVEELRKELRDRFGAAPKPVLQLLDVMGVRALAAELGIKTITASKQGVTVDFTSTRYLEPEVQAHLRNAFGDTIQFAWETTPSIQYALKKGEHPVDETNRLLEALAAEE